MVSMGDSMSHSTHQRRWFRVQAIGTVRRPDTAGSAPGDYVDPWREVVLEIDPRWEPGLEGIEGFSHLVVVFYLDRAKRRRRAGSPRPPEHEQGFPPVGFFATRTPERPNPVGISCPRLLRRDGNLLIVTGIDAWDGTPILDLKGYYPRDELRPDAIVPAWLQELWQRHDRTRESLTSVTAEAGPLEREKMTGDSSSSA
jgi:tRNA-Thr(GGU) m(6)t(6)A37 methyltransferase TsaA